MGTAIYIVTQKEIEDLDTFVNGKAIGKASDKAMFKICREIGQPSLYDFVSQDPEELREMIEESGADVPENLPDEMWFQPDEGKKFVTELLKYFHANSKAMKNVEGLIEDLDEYERIFDELQVRGVKWHFAVDC